MTKKQTYALIAGVAVLVIALVAGVLALGKKPEADTATSQKESTESVEASWTVEATGSVTATGTSDAAEAPVVEQTQPSYKRYAYIAGVGGTADNSYVVVDFFDIYTQDAAKTYAQEHGLKVPSNGILYANEANEAVTIPLSSTVNIIYKTGGVESMTQKTATVEQLRQWANGNTDALPGSMTNMWEVTVQYGIAIKIEMVAVAD